MTCPPCNVGDHDNCVTEKDGPTLLGLGQSWRCPCWEHRGVHAVWAKVAVPARSNWSDEEIRDHQHDTGEDEFDTWIARNEEDD